MARAAQRHLEAQLEEQPRAEPCDAQLGRQLLGAEDYADEILSTLEVNLEKFLAAVQRGRDRLAGREEEPAEVG